MAHILTTISFLISIWFCCLSASTIYVDAGNSRRGNGSQKNPYQMIQLGITRAQSSDTVLVMPGTYREAIDFLGKAITVQSYSGPSTTIIDGSGLSGVSPVTFHNNETLNSILQGFTITNGTGTLWTFGTTQELAGGGIFCVSSSPTISNVILKSNSADHGGGICGISGSNCLMTNVQFINNTASFNGGGAHFFDNCNPTFQSSTFTGNTSFHTGGAINVRSYSFANISNCTFTKNRTTLFGGAVRVAVWSSGMVDGCTFTENVVTTSYGGGGVAAGGDQPGTTGRVTITNSSFNGNTAPDGGTELSIIGNYPAIIDISNSYVIGGNTQTSVYVDPSWDRDTYLIWGPGMTSVASKMSSLS